MSRGDTHDGAVESKSGADPPLVVAGRTVNFDAGVLSDLDGAPIGLRPQAWAVLCVLARRAGSVVTKAELFDTVWHELAVTDASLTRAVSDLRAAFGRDGHQVIRTVARRGYMLIAPEAAAAARAPQPNAALPAPSGPLFGREADLAAVRDLLARRRLVTVVGAGGIGKTAVAVAAARSHAAETSTRAAWVDLAQLADPNLLVATMARSFGLPVAQGGEQLPALLVAVAPVKALLVLDNAEHLIAGVSRLTRAMLDAAPGLYVLVTSQAPLGIENEHVFRLAALEVPTDSVSLDEAAEFGAVALFVDQARARDRNFDLDPTNLGLVIDLCRKLEGLPLAIRLAAARLPLLGLAAVNARLNERLQLLASDSRDAPARQQTLLAALDWSHSLLEPHEQALFRRLGVFVGGFSLDLAVAMARCDGIDEWTLIERLGVLVERSLIDVDRIDPPRYRMLEAQREYASRLRRRAGDAAFASRHLALAVEDVMRRSGEEIWLTADAVWLPRWAPELDNVRVALEWSAANDAALFASLAGSTATLFRSLDLAYEMRRRAAAVAPEVIDALAPELAMRYWLARSTLESGVSAQAANDFAVRAESFARIVGDRRSLYMALCYRVASSLFGPGDTKGMEEEIASLECGTWAPRIRALRAMAEFGAHGMRDQWALALRAAEAGYALTFDAGTTLMQATLANGILVALMSQGDVHEAVKRSRVLRERVLAGPVGPAIPFIGTSARCSLLAGDIAGARRQLVHLFDMCRTVEWMYFDYFCSLYVTLALIERRFEDAARLFGYAETSTQRGWRVPRLGSTRDEARGALTAALEPDRLELLVSEGTGLGREAACALVLKDPEPARRASSAGLTARQAEVLSLVGHGQTDKQIARGLGLSPRTVEMHVAHAIESLRCRNRAEAVRTASELGLLHK